MHGYADRQHIKKIGKKHFIICSLKIPNLKPMVCIVLIFLYMSFQYRRYCSELDEGRVPNEVEKMVQEQDTDDDEEEEQV